MRKSYKITDLLLLRYCAEHKGLFCIYKQGVLCLVGFLDKSGSNDPGREGAIALYPKY